MKIDFGHFFKQYEIITDQVDRLVNKVQKDFPGLVTCKTKCSDCCNALFDITLIEALYINDCFNKTISQDKKYKIIEISNSVDRKIHRLKRQAQKFVKDGKKSSEQVLYEMSTFKVRCPLLNSRDLCEMYEFRPITCRVYGVPTSFAGKGHTCGFSGFETGKSYPTINLDAVHEKLFLLSSEFVKKIKSKHVRMAEMLMPVSMVLLTKFDHKYLGLKIEERKA